MFKNNIQLWLTRLAFGVALIAVYKTFDDFSGIASAFNTITRVLAPFIFGGVIAFLFYLPAKKLEGVFTKSKAKLVHKNARPISVATTLICFILILTAILVLFIPALYDNIMIFAKSVPDYLNNLYQLIEQNTENAQWLSDAVAQLQQQFTFQKIVSWLDIGSYVKGLQSFVGILLNLCIGIILAVYILLDRSALKRNFNRITSLILKPKHTAMMSKLSTRTSRVLYGFLYGQSLDAALIGVIAGVGFAVLQIPNASVLGLIYGLCCLVPYFGAFFGVFTVSMFTLLSGGVDKMIVAFIYIAIVQQVDGNLINPRVIGNSLGIKPLYVIFGAMTFGGLFRIIGLIIGPPIMAVVVETTKEFISERELFVRAKKKFENDPQPYDPDTDPE